MIDLYSIWTIARCEARLLFRSWAFRIFSVIALVFLVFMNIGIFTNIGRSPYYIHSLSGSLPLMNIKLLNIYQGIIAAFLATEFIKRDRRHDTTQVVFTRSFSNADYLLGKIIGILTVFATLNLSVLAVTFVIHYFFSPTIFAWQPYLIYTLLISLPTLIFVIGLSFLLITLLRSQALVFVLMMGYSLLVLIFLGSHLFHVFDSYAFHQPLIYSDFIGLGNLNQLLLIRGAYLLLGISFLALTVLLTQRLRQSTVNSVLAALIAVVCLFTATSMGFSYLKDQFADRKYRHRLQTSSQAVTDIPTVTVKKCDISLGEIGENLSATASFLAVNDNQTPFDSLLFTLNPGLKVDAVTGDGKQFQFRQENQLLWIKPLSVIEPADSCVLSISYSGFIDQHYCFLDIDTDRYEGLYEISIYRIPKLYGIVSKDYLHLTPETGWYPISGLAPGAAFPAATKFDYAQFSLSVVVPPGMVAISQGTLDIDTTDGDIVYNFKSETPLPQISLTIGKYELRSIEVDSITYSLYHLAGHDYFTPFLDQATDTLPDLIRELKNEYEMLLGFEYAHTSFSLVEIPIQIYSYRRLWSVAQEMVQPQVVFLPEMGTICASSDFQRMKRGATRRQERANQADSPKEIQAGYFTNFVKADLLGLQSGMRFFRLDESVEPRFEILPNYISYVTHISSDRWPVLNYAFESYLQNRVSPPPNTRGRRWRGLTNIEKANLEMKHLSLADLVGGSNLKPVIASAALQAKGRFLFSLLEAQSGDEQFSNQINQFLTSSRFHDTPDRELINFTANSDDSSFAAMIDTWYYDTLLPGYLVEEIECYKILDGERTRTQLRFQITNPTQVAGVVKVNLRNRQRQIDFQPRWMRGQTQNDYSRTLLVPAMTQKDVGIIVDEPLAEMTIETYVAQNIPSVISIPFREQKLKSGSQPFEGENIKAIENEPPEDQNEYIVDNEDTGFNILSHTEENWLRRTLLRLFGSENDQDPYVGMRFWDLPGNWLLTTDQKFYGRFIRSGHYKESGDGESNVSWSIELSESGDYDIFYYEGDLQMPRWFGRNRGREQRLAGEKHFLVYHEDGVNDPSLDLNDTDDGWNFLGTYRLSAGKNKVELTDEGVGRFITADAVRWVKR